MGNSRKKHLGRSLIGLLIGGTFLYLTLHNKPLGPVWESLANVDFTWIFLSFCCLLIVFFLRALRWQILLEQGRSRLLSDRIFTALLLGYFVNSFTPKLGEIIRCTTVKRTCGIPVPVSMGTVMAERVYDLLVLASGLCIILLVEMQRLRELIDSTIGGVSHIYGYRYFLAALLIVLILVGLFYVSQKRRNKFKNQTIDKIVHFLREMFSSLKQGFHLKKAWRFFLLTLLIWIFLILLNFCYLKALPDTHGFPAAFALVVLFIGGVGWALPSPGGIGTTHFFLLQLFLVYNLNPQSGISFGILSNGLTFLYTILLGMWGWMRYEVEKQHSPDPKTIREENPQE